MLGSILFAAAGVLLVVFILSEVFEALVLPRRVDRPFRFTRHYYRAGWRVWVALTRLVPGRRRRHLVLSTFGPFSLLVLFAIWAAGLVVGFGLIHHGFAPPGRGLAESIYLSGVTFTTVGYGDVAPGGSADRVVAVAEAATGLGFVAVAISYLPVLYGAFSRREAFVIRLDARAGSPPAAGRLLARLGPGPALDRFLVDAEQWAAEVLEGHLSYPVLGYYRSQHNNQSWLSTLACTLDASALLLTVVDGADRVQARLTFATARHLLADLAPIMLQRPARPPRDRLPPGRLDGLVRVVRDAGFAVRDDAAAREKLAELRQLYEPLLAGLGRHFRLRVPAVWPSHRRPDNWQVGARAKAADLSPPGPGRPENPPPG